MIEAPTVRFTTHDFFTGVFCALIVGGREKFSCYDHRPLHAAFAVLFTEELQEEAASNGLDIRFRLWLGMHGLSGTVDSGIWSCRASGLLGTDSDRSLLFRFSNNMAENVLRRLPGTPDMYKRLAASFEMYLRGVR